MKRLILHIALITATTTALPAQIIANDFVQKGSAQLSREDEVYNQGQTGLNESRWTDALDKFNQVIRMKGGRAEAAMYWKAVSLNKLGRTQEALTAINDLRRQDPNSRWSNDARALEIEIKGANAGEGPKGPGPKGTEGTVDRGGRNEDEELKLLALNRLMDRDEDRAIPLLERFLQNNQSKRLRERALFVLGQSDNPKANELISRIARGELYPELQTKAIHQIGVVNASDKNMETLSQIYASTNNYDVKRTILHTFGVSGDTARLLKAARGEKDVKLQRDAIHGLGISGSKTELRQLYKELPSYEAKSAVLDAFIVSGDSEGFQDVARTEADPKLRRQAIRGIGINGGRGSGATLVAIFSNAKDAETKSSALEALFVSDNAKALVDLARAEKDPVMKRRVIEKLSVMDDKEATDYMIEILNK